jgi:altronate hydrolase
MTDKMTDPRLLVLAQGDNIGVLIATVSAGEEIMIGGQSVTVPDTLGLGHKLAVAPIEAGKDILKYGFPIGFAAEDIPLGTHVHVHNLTSRYTTVEVME